MRRSMPTLILLLLVSACSEGESRCTKFYEAGVCGRDGEPPSCSRGECSQFGDPTPVCGCDGAVYEGVCAAFEARVDLDDEGMCELDPGRFACGPFQCLRGTEYCAERIGWEYRSNYSCAGVPAECDPPACDCLSHPHPSSECTAVDGELFLRY